jgi:TfoX/Sxy family transcriptional regulator of competence genes
MGKWKPAPAAAVAAFDKVTDGLDEGERKKMFGYSCMFARGQLFVGLHEAGMVLRLNEKDREAFLRIDGAAPFVPMPGRTMREYVVVPNGLLEAPAKLRPWVEKSLAFVLTLPEKKPRKAKVGREGRAS